MMYPKLFHIASVSLAVTLLTLMSAVAPALALNFKANSRKPLSAELEWRFADYSSKSSAGTDFEGSHFVQRYAMLYTLSGNIYNSRAGLYNGGLGLEWWNIDATFGDEDISLSNLKPLYNGELILAPAGLPLRMHLFAYDRSSAAFIEEDYRNGVLDSNIVTDASNGEHHVIGGTLVAGIKNGSYAGEYREHLSALPRLFIDFRQDLVRDKESTTPQHYRNRNLAFVSLNKKDNWFHYRFFDHKDYLDADNDYTEKTILLGTIDHRLYRQWIWLTNWLKLSTDGSFTTIDYVNADSGDAEQRFDYNLFLVGKRNGLAYSNFNTFSRSSRNDQLHRALTVPLYLSYDLSPDRKVHIQTILERDESQFRNFPDGDSASDIVYLSGKLETGMTKPLRFDPSLEVEMLEGSLGRGQSARGYAELYTNPRYRADREWLLSYSLANFRGSPPEENARDVNFLEQIAEASLAFNVRPNLRVGATQRLLFGSGELDSSVSSRIRPESEESWFEDSQSGGDTLRSSTGVFAEHAYGRLANRFEANLDYLKAGSQDDRTYVELLHRLRYETGQFRVRMKNELQFGDQDYNQGFTASQLGVGSAPDGSDLLFESHTEARYLPNRNWSVTGLVDYLWRGGGDNDRKLLRFREKASYTFFHVNGIMRRWLELHQELDIEQSWEAFGDDLTYGKFTVGGIFYPTYNTYLRGNLGYEWYDPGFTQITYGLGVGVDFPRFKVEANYGYGISEEDDTGEKITDHRWELNIKKLI